MNKKDEYINRFYEEKITAYDFLMIFSAVNVLENNYFFSRDDLLAYIKNCKNKNKYNELLEAIIIKSNGIFCYSENFEDSIFQLKLAGILYTISPEKDSTIYINENIQIWDIINPRIDYLNETIKFNYTYNKTLKQENNYKKILVNRRIYGSNKNR